MKQIYLIITVLFLVSVFPACDEETALEKAEPWSVDGITPQTITVERPGYAGLQYQVYIIEEGNGPHRFVSLFSDGRTLRGSSLGNSRTWSVCEGFVRMNMMKAKNS